MMILPEKCLISLKQAQAQMKFNEWQNSDFVILDTETTGLSGEICEIAVIDREGNVLLNSLVLPKQRIPIEAIRIHGITNEMVAKAPTWPEIWGELYNLIKNSLILIYNNEFDIRLMKESFYHWRDELGQERVNELIETIDKLNTDCVMRTYAQLIGSERWVKLSQACKGKYEEHRALGDCRATLEVVRSAYNPDFTQKDFEIIKWRYDLEEVSRRIRFLNYRIQELTSEQMELLKQQKKLLQRLKPDASQEVAATQDPFADTGKPLDIEDLENLPF